VLLLVLHEQHDEEQHSKDADDDDEADAARDHVTNFLGDVLHQRGLTMAAPAVRAHFGAVATGGHIV